MKYRQTVREIALDQFGYVTTRDAANAGVPAVELRKLAARGTMLHTVSIASPMRGRPSMTVSPRHCCASVRAPICVAMRYSCCTNWLVFVPT